MRATSPLRLLVLSVAALLMIGTVMLIPSPASDAAPPLCDGKPATIVGTSGDDVLKGTGGDDVIVGLGGDDLIKGRGGNDTLCGYGGNDTLIGGPGNDVMIGGRGSDWVAYGLAPNGVTVDLGAGWDPPRGTADGWGSDRLYAIASVGGSPCDGARGGDAGPPGI